MCPYRRSTWQKGVSFLEVGRRSCIPSAVRFRFSVGTIMRTIKYFEHESRFLQGLDLLPLQCCAGYRAARNRRVAQETLQGVSRATHLEYTRQ